MGEWTRERDDALEGALDRADTAPTGGQPDGAIVLPTRTVRDLRAAGLAARAELATMRDHLEALRLASRAPLHEPLVDAVAGLAAVFDEHTRIRDLLGVRPGDDPVEAVRGLVEEVEGLRAREHARRSLTAGDILAVLDRLGAPPLAQPEEFPAYEQVHQRVEGLAAQRDEARVEVARLRAGGCARDQRLTQHCPLAEEARVEVERLARALWGDSPDPDVAPVIPSTDKLLEMIRELQDSGAAYDETCVELAQANAEVERLRAVIAEPTEGELARLGGMVMQQIMGGVLPVNVVRALLADQRRRAGGEP